MDTLLWCIFRLGMRFHAEMTSLSKFALISVLLQSARTGYTMRFRVQASCDDHPNSLSHWRQQRHDRLTAAEHNGLIRLLKVVIKVVKL